MNMPILELFVKYQQARSFAQATIDRRSSSINTFARFIAPVPLEQANAADVDEWVGTLRAPRTKHAYRSDLAAFYGWALRRRLVAENPVAGTDAVRVPRSLPRPVPTIAVPHLIITARQPLRTGLALAAYAGLRRIEIVRLTTDDVTFGDDARLVVRCGKGSKDRSVPIHPALAAELQDRRPQGSRWVPLTAQQLGRRAAEHMRRHGFDCTLHQLRHSFGTEAARAWNGNVQVVGNMMGHESANTTLGYAKLVTPVDRVTLAAMYGTSDRLRSAS